MPSDTWPDADVATLRQLWAEGHSTAEIGRRMRRTKSAIVGKAHRLELPPRPSPIPRDGSPRPPPAPRVPRATRVTIAPLQCLASPVQPASAPVAPAAPPRPVRPAPAPVVRRTPCCWPIGEPGTPAFRFCDAPSDGRTAYCAQHAAVAYEPRTERDRLDRRLLKRMPARG